MQSYALRIVYRDNLSAITKYITKVISVIAKSKLFSTITIIGNKLLPISYLDKWPSLTVGLTLLSLSSFSLLSRLGSVALLCVTSPRCESKYGLLIVSSCVLHVAIRLRNWRLAACGGLSLQI